VTTTIGINGYKKRKNFGNITVQKWECGIEFLRERERDRKEEKNKITRKKGREARRKYKGSHYKRKFP